MVESIRAYLREIKNIPLLTREQELELSKKAKAGDEKACEQMVRSNLRLVINIAKRYYYLRLPLVDLIEEGNLGLMKAVSKYNPKKGFRFSTYASWWIKQYILRAIANQAKTVRIPVYMVEIMSRFQRVYDELAQRHHRKPRVSEIAKVMGIPEFRVRKIMQIATSTSSLDAPVGEDGKSQMIDFIEDENAVSPEDELASFLRHERVDDLLVKMNKREREILSMRYGLNDGEEKTLGETSKCFGISRERVRQIEERAMNKLRRFVRLQKEEYE